MNAFIKPSDPVNNHDGRFLVKLKNQGQDWQVIVLNNGEKVAENWFSVWQDNIKGSGEHAIRTMCKRVNLETGTSEIHWSE